MAALGPPPISRMCWALSHSCFKAAVWFGHIFVSQKGQGKGASLGGSNVGDIFLMDGRRALAWLHARECLVLAGVLFAAAVNIDAWLC